jgi:asparagine synthase (glutamine-hydrolysing)
VPKGTVRRRLLDLKRGDVAGHIGELRSCLVPDTGAQPLVNEDETIVLAVNGEIYNHVALRKSLKHPATFKTHSDCEVIMHLVRLHTSTPPADPKHANTPQYKEHDTGLCNMLDGMFSFVLLDTSVTPSRIIAARDPIGITTLYMGYHSSSPDTIYFSSELKTLHEECDNLIAFPPGHFYDSRTKQIERYFKPTWWDSDKGVVPHDDVDYKVLRETLEKAVRKRLMSEVPYGVLLSGGLDSSLIASIAARETDKLAEEQERLRKERQHAIAEGREPGEPRSYVAIYLHTLC